jgi:hypothetical protein
MYPSRKGRQPEITKIYSRYWAEEFLFSKAVLTSFVLKCAIPAFESLVPNEKYSKSIISIITVCAEWHTLAKLRMHTDVTLQLLQRTTVKLGSEFRAFLLDVCSSIQTEELTAEVQARLRRFERQRAEREKEKVEAKKTDEEGRRVGGEASQNGGVGQGQKSTETTNAKKPKKGRKAQDTNVKGGKAGGAKGTKVKQAMKGTKGATPMDETTVETISVADTPAVQSTVSLPSSAASPRD